MNITFDLSSFRQQLGKTQDRIAEATRPAAQAGAQVIYETAKARVPVSAKEHYFYGSSYKKTGQRYGPYAPGNLRDSVYQVYSKDKSSRSKSEYQISWNFKKAPYGFMVHNGTSRSPAHPFITSAMHDRGEEALGAMKERFLKEINK